MVLFQYCGHWCGFITLHVLQYLRFVLEALVGFLPVYCSDTGSTCGVPYLCIILTLEALVGFVNALAVAVLVTLTLCGAVVADPAQVTLAVVRFHANTVVVTALYTLRLTRVSTES